jgi:hypothetical protein
MDSMNTNTPNTEKTPDSHQFTQLPVYQTSIAVNLATALIVIFSVFNGPRVGC